MTDDEWQERLRAAVEKTLRTRQARRAEREQLTERRNHGLAARHNAKLARTPPKPEPTEPEDAP